MINSAKIPVAYSEVYSLLKVLGNDYISKIPKSIYNVIEENRDTSYNPIFDDIENLNISHEGLSLIAALNLQYWCYDENKKNELKEIYANNEKIENEKYSYDNLFKTDDVETNKPITAIVEYKENIFKKIINKIKNFLSRNK